MLHTQISPPGAATARFQPANPPGIPQHHRRRFLSLVGQFERDEIEAAVDGLIALLDARDGNPDIELNGDEADGNDSEDDFMRHGYDYAAGCPLADPAEDDDPGEDDGDDRDAAFAEWRPYDSPTLRFAKGMQEAMQHEDAEDSDSDRCAAGDDAITAGPVVLREWWDRLGDRIGDDTDAEVEDGV